MKPYKLETIQAIKADNKRKGTQLSIDMQERLEDALFKEHLVCHNEAIFHTNSDDNKHHVGIWGTENSRTTVQYERYLPKVNIFGATSKKHIHSPFFFDGYMTGDVYLQMFQKWPRYGIIGHEHEDISFLKEAAPPHRKLTLRAYLNDNMLANGTNRECW